MMSKSDSLGIASTYFLHAGMLDAPLKGFTMLLGERGYQPESVAAHRCSVAHFGHWATQQGLCVSDLDEHLLMRFASHRCACPGGRRMTAVSRRYVARVRRFLAFLSEEGCEQVELPARAVGPGALQQYRMWLLA